MKEILKSADPTIKNLARIYENSSTSAIKKECEKRFRDYVSKKETSIMHRSKLKRS